MVVTSVEEQSGGLRVKGNLLPFVSSIGTVAIARLRVVCQDGAIHEVELPIKKPREWSIKPSKILLTKDGQGYRGRAMIFAPEDTELRLSDLKRVKPEIAASVTGSLENVEKRSYGFSAIVCFPDSPAMALLDSGSILVLPLTRELRLESLLRIE